MKKLLLLGLSLVMASRVVLADMSTPPVFYVVPAFILAGITFVVGLLVVWAYKKIKKISKKNDVENNN